MSKPLIIIVILAAFIRLASLSSFPAGLNADEAALGYNAYSLLLTGKDEHGRFLPANLESFGDFKPALYSYLLVPAIKIFGLNILAVRLPSALFGILSVVLAYYFSKQTLPKYKGLPEITALALAINPWAIHFSRGAWEVNIATTLILLGVVAFLRRRYGIFAISFILSLYDYQSARVIAPLLGLGLVIVYHVRIWRFVPYVILLIPLAVSLVTSDASSRLSGVGLLADEGPLNRVKELRGQHSSSTAILSKVLHNRPVIYSIQFLSNYLDHFDGNFLFVNGDAIQRSKVPETGLFYLSDFIFLAWGVFVLLRRPAANSKVVWLWILVAPIAAALTFQTPHALRAHNLVIPLVLLVSLGLSQVSARKILVPLVALIYVWQFGRFMHEYYVHYPKTYPAAWEYGFDQVTRYVLANENKFQNVYITDKYDQPYILFLFYSQTSPEVFQASHQLTFRDKYNFSTVRDFGKYHFVSTSWDKLRDKHSSLIIAAPEDIPNVGVNTVGAIYFPNGSPAFKIVAN